MAIVIPQETRIPERLTFAAGDERTQKAIAWIAQRHRLTDAATGLQTATTPEDVTQAFLNSQVFLLAASVGEVLMGRLHPNYLIRALSQRMGIGMDDARAIAHDVSREIFAHVKQELVDVYHMQVQPEVHEPTPVGGESEPLESAEPIESTESLLRQEYGGQAIAQGGTGLEEASQAAEAAVPETPARPASDGLAEQVFEGTFPTAPPTPEAPPPTPQQISSEALQTPEASASFTPESSGPHVVDLRNIDNIENSFAPPPPQNNP